MAKVVMYTTRTCPFCKMQMEYLDSQGVKYDRILVDEDTAQIPKMVEISGQMGVPFTVIEKDSGEKIAILGFDRKRIDDALGLSS